MSDQKKNKLYCTECGNELGTEDKFCSKCGSPVQKGKKNIKPSNRDKSPDQNFTGSQKKISGIKLAYLVFGLIVIVLLINYAAGVFEKPIVSTEQSQAQSETSTNSGVDLQHLEQINSMEESLKNNPNDKTTLLNLAHLLNDSGLKDRAIEKYKAYLKIDSQNADVLVDMGVCYYELGKYDDAISQMKEALKYQPRHQIAHLNLGIVNLTAGNHDEAISWWKKAVEINPATEIAKRAQEFINSH